MKSIISLVLTGVLASSLVCSDNLTEQNTARANEAIEAAAETHSPRAVSMDEVRAASTKETLQARR
jgi:hypothetical protein